MEHLQKFCDGASQSVSYPRLDGGPVTLLAAGGNGSIVHGQQGGCGKQLTRVNRSFGQSPYCCPSTSQQSKLLYNLLSSRPKDTADHMGYFPIIEHQTVSHQTAYNGSHGNTDSTNPG